MTRRMKLGRCLGGIAILSVLTATDVVSQAGAIGTPPRPVETQVGRYVFAGVGIDQYQGQWPTLANAVNDVDASSASSYIGSPGSPDTKGPAAEDEDDEAGFVFLTSHATRTCRHMKSKIFRCYRIDTICGAS